MRRFLFFIASGWRQVWSLPVALGALAFLFLPFSGYWPYAGNHLDPDLQGGVQ
jgi:hypothetical protein